MMQLFFKNLAYFNLNPYYLKLACIMENCLLQLLGKALFNDNCKFGFNLNVIFSHVEDTKSIVILVKCSGNRQL